jgi:pilus assembly protein Flp/PilA
MTEFFATLQAIFTSRVEGDKGATAVEYGLMVSLIAVVIIAAVTLLGQNLTAIFNQVAAAI